MRSISRSSFAFLIAWVASCAAADASATPVETCIAAHENGQVLRREGKLRTARQQLEACTASACPAEIRSDCAAWRSELADAVPTVVFSLRDEQGPVRAARIFVDDEPITDPTDGRALPIDPGSHVFRFEASDGRVVTKTLIVLEGVKNRVITAIFGGGEAPTSTSSSLPIGMWVAGSVGVAGIVIFGVLGGVGLSKETDLRDTCQGSCAQGDVDEVERLYLAADVVGAIGLAALATAVVIGVVLAVDDESVASIEFRPSVAGANLRVTF